MHKPKPRALPLLLYVLGTLLTACSVVPRSSPPSAPTPPATQPPQIPALPPEARQPQSPELCSPTCSEGLRRRLQNLLP